MTEYNPAETTVENFERICRSLFEVRQELKEIEEHKKIINARRAEIENEIKAHFVVLDKSKHSTGLGTISVRQELNFAVPKEPADRDALFEYLDKKGVKDEMLTIHHKTLNSFAKAEFEIAVEEQRTSFEIPGLGAPTYRDIVTVRSTK